MSPLGPQSGYPRRVEDFGAAESAIRRAISVVDDGEDLSEFEISDYLGTPASILRATERESDASEMRNRAEKPFQKAKSQEENGE